MMDIYIQGERERERERDVLRETVVVDELMEMLVR